MKRYFDIPNSKLTLQLNVTEEGMRYSVKQLEKALKIEGLIEIDKKEYKRLSKEYTK